MENQHVCCDLFPREWIFSDCLVGVHNENGRGIARENRGFNFSSTVDSSFASLFVDVVDIDRIANGDRYFRAIRVDGEIVIGKSESQPKWDLLLLAGLQIQQMQLGRTNNKSPLTFCSAPSKSLKTKFVKFVFCGVIVF
jgi:hypothetical protein